MDAFFLSGAAHVAVIVMAVMAAISVLAAIMMRDQPTLKGPILMLALAVAFSAGAWYVHNSEAAAKDEAVAARYKYLKNKYGVRVRATPEVTDLEKPGRWRIGDQFRPCHLAESKLTLADPVVLCQTDEGKYWELPKIADRS